MQGIVSVDSLNTLELDLFDNKMGDEGANYISDGLVLMKNLTSLNLGLG